MKDRHGRNDGDPVLAERPDRRPIATVTGKPIGPLPQPGYYPGFSTIAQQDFWDAKTREVILDRLNNVPPIRFFSHDQFQIMEVLCEHIVPQSDRNDDHKIPIVPYIDRRLYDNRTDGYQFEDMPPDREAYQLGLAGIDEIADHLHHRAFVDVGAYDRDKILRLLHDAKPPAAYEIWKRLPVHRFWMLLVQDCVEVYYAHPWAWDEIGFGGPAYPRAYMRLENGQPETWEVNECRYEWKAPPTSVSDISQPVARISEHIVRPGRGGTH